MQFDECTQTKCKRNSARCQLILSCRSRSVCICLSHLFSRYSKFLTEIPIYNHAQAAHMHPDPHLPSLPCRATDRLFSNFMAPRPISPNWTDRAVLCMTGFALASESFHPSCWDSIHPSCSDSFHDSLHVRLDQEIQDLGSPWPLRHILSTRNPLPTSLF
jgi:hypothetical protein